MRNLDVSKTNEHNLQIKGTPEKRYPINVPWPLEKLPGAGDDNVTHPT